MQEKIKPGSHKEELERLLLEQERDKVVQELIDSVPEDEPERENIQEILRFATTFASEDAYPIQKYVFYDRNTGSYYSKLEVRITNSRWKEPEYRQKINMLNWIKAFQYSEEFFEKKMKESDNS